MESEEEKREEQQREAVELLMLQDHRPDACVLTVLGLETASNLSICIQMS